MADFRNTCIFQAFVTYLCKRLLKQYLAKALHIVCFISLFVLISLLAISCSTMQAVNANKPVEYILFVQAAKFWQDSGVYVRRGELIQCTVEGTWNNYDLTYGPEGNPDIYNDHLGVSAPANSLIMRLSSETNHVYYIGSESNIVAERSGNVLFRNNFSLPVGLSGELKVALTIATDADKDKVSDYEEVNIWHTDPLDPDTDGDGFTDLEEITDKKKSIPITQSIIKSNE